MNELRSPRQCRLKLNQMEAWFRDNQNRFSPTEQVVFRSLFEIAVTPSDVVEMGKALCDRMRPETPADMALIPPTPTPRFESLHPVVPRSGSTSEETNHTPHLESETH